MTKKDVLVLEVNPVYSIYKGPSILSDLAKEATVYKVINEKYGVVELETTAFPKALMEANNYYRWIEKLTNEMEFGEEEDDEIEFIGQIETDLSDVDFDDDDFLH